VNQNIFEGVILSFAVNYICCGAVNKLDHSGQSFVDEREFETLEMLGLISHEYPSF